jgi:uncharacterized RDD family membrane protein YckC
MNNLEYVGFWERFLATLIDSVLFLILTSSVFYFIYGVTFIEESLEFNLLNTVINYIIPFILVLILWQYTSTTPGKAFFQATIVDADSFEKPTKKQFFIRNISYLLSILPFGLGFFWIIWDKKKQSWHDKLANTVVIEPKVEAKKISILGYMGRGFGILFILLMMMFFILGFVGILGKVPDESLYRVERLNDEVVKELVEKNIIYDASLLLYLNPSSMLSFTESGTAILKDGIVSYEQDENGKSRSIKFYFKDIGRLKIEVKDVMLGMQTLTLYIYDRENDLVFFDIMIPKTIKAEDLKKELMNLWKESDTSI